MKLYLDTSIFGGYFESEFELWTKKLIELILNGDYIAIISDLTLLELNNAPKDVKSLADKIIKTNSEFITTSEDCLGLQIFICMKKLLHRNSDRMLFTLLLQRLIKLMLL